MSEELYRVYRPQALEEVIGQKAAVDVLEKHIDEGTLPHSILFSGSSGCGKTTLARILKDELQCGDADYTELNSSDFRGVDSVREIRRRMGMAPISGKCRIWLIDECHMMTAPAQEAALKMLEDPPKKVYFFLCTTDPQKLKKPLRSRCLQIRIEPLLKSSILEICNTVAEQAELDVSEDVLEKIAEMCEGSARSALVLLDSIRHVEGEDEQLEIISRGDIEVQAIELARKLLNPKCTFKGIAPILKGLQEDAEEVRRLILAYSTSVMVGGGKVDRCYVLIDSFRDNFYDSGKAGLAAACYEVCAGGR